MDIMRPDEFLAALPSIQNDASTAECTESISERTKVAEREEREERREK